MPPSGLRMPASPGGKPSATHEPHTHRRIFTLATIQASQLIYLSFNLGFVIGIATSFHAMTSYCIFSLRTTLHKLDALQKLNGRQRMQGLLACELLTPALQEAFEDISPKPSLTRKSLSRVSPVSIALNPASVSPYNDIESGGQLPEASISIASNGEAYGAKHRKGTGRAGDSPYG